MLCKIWHYTQLFSRSLPRCPHNYTSYDIIWRLQKTCACITYLTTTLVKLGCIFFPADGSLICVGAERLQWVLKSISVLPRLEQWQSKSATVLSSQIIACCLPVPTWLPNIMIRTSLKINTAFQSQSCCALGMVHSARYRQYVHISIVYTHVCNYSSFSTVRQIVKQNKPEYHNAGRRTVFMRPGKPHGENRGNFKTKEMCLTSNVGVNQLISTNGSN